MASQRLKIVVECLKSNKEEIELYEKLSNFTYPGVIIKEILLGKLPLSILKGNEDEK